MPSFYHFLAEFLDSMTGHLALTAYLLAVTNERTIGRRLKKLPLLLLSPLLAVLLSAALYAVPELGRLQYFLFSFAILIMCSVWVQRTWKFGFWCAFATTCMASIFQVATTALSTLSFQILPWRESFSAAAALGLHLGISIAVALLLYGLRFGMCFRLLLNNEPAPWRTALLLFALEITMEVLLLLVNGVQAQYFFFYYILVITMVVLMATLVVYMAQRFDAARKMQAQQDIIVQQQLYEQELEMLRLEVRAFRHDYKNLLAGLSQQTGESELDGLRHTLSELEAGFDLRLGKKIQASAQIGNVRIPEVRSLLLSKLALIRKKNVECCLEVLYPVLSVDMEVWDFVRCLGILLDNAIEAALDTEQPWMEMILLAQDTQVFLRVSNSYVNPIDAKSMWKESWSTKGTNRGVGLASYQHILETYPNASSSTSWENGVFVQELTVEQREGAPTWRKK